MNNAPAAAALSTGIPTTFRYDVTASLTGGTNTLWDQAASQNRYTVGDSVQGNARSILVKNAIPFFSANDPRVPAHYKIASERQGHGEVAGRQSRSSFRSTVLWGQSYGGRGRDGIDARLIEAEAALQAGNAAGMMTILNALRATPHALTAPSPTASGTHPGLDDAGDGGADRSGHARRPRDLLFREKAFWTFGRGQRLGDLRRLIRDYGRAATRSFPVGSTIAGATYGADVNLPVTTGEQNGNPNFSQCLDRKA